MCLSCPNAPLCVCRVQTLHSVSVVSKRSTLSLSCPNAPLSVCRVQTLHCLSVVSKRSTLCVSATAVSPAVEFPVSCVRVRNTTNTVTAGTLTVEWKKNRCATSYCWTCVQRVLVLIGPSEEVSWCEIFVEIQFASGVDLKWTGSRESVVRRPSTALNFSTCRNPSLCQFVTCTCNMTDRARSSVFTVWLLAPPRKSVAVLVSKYLYTLTER